MSALKPPRRKRRIYQQLDSPFPVPIESITKKPASSNRWFYYTGVLKENSVLVQQQGDVLFLYKMGFFGKGMLSKSKPEHNIYLNSYQGLRKKNLPPKERRFQQQRFQQVRKTRYERHLSWSKQFVRQARNLTTDEDDTSASVDDLPTSSENNGDHMIPLQSSGSQEKEDGCTQSDDVTAGIDEVSTGTCSVMQRTDDIASRTEDVTSRTDDVTSRTDDVTSRTDVRARTDDVTSRTDDFTTRTDDDTSRTDDVTSRTDDFTTGTYSVTSRTDDVASRTDDVTSRTDDVTSRTDDVTTRTDDVTTRNDDVTTTSDMMEVCELPEASSKSAINLDVTNSTDETLRNRNSDQGSQSDMADNAQVSSSTLPDTEGVGSKEETEDQSLIRKEDPYEIHEYLQLKLEEAFFLSYGLGCLTVLDENKKALDLTEMWQAFCYRQRNFVASYVAYHYYRSKGWVPRDGLKYGAHYVLYKHGPPFYHGSYSVIIQMVTEGSWDSSDTSPVLTWPAVSGMDRITETVAKEVVFCYVIRPSDLSDQDMQSPRCIPRFKVQEILMKRWVSSRERDVKDHLPPLIS
ncbi:tRNA-splicing endonuclease subunit Sen2-like [Patiria miniata]|uniref:tRNA-intron lyase n=1 Tax=Patiria miniata TaxID=46514 RepID=A0A913ZM43_PATMI|nr:tRNA-splicing endonuclease subunit Sen2-like [Patiria miniata]XP_038052170.1 tRNA-splicing endonuclease subunit Sen2-like [Patiria miniata]